MSDISQIEQLKKKLQARKEEKARLEGRLEGVLNQLKEIGYPDIDAADAELDRLSEVIEDSEKELHKGIDEFIETYGDVL